MSQRLSGLTLPLQFLVVINIMPVSFIEISALVVSFRPPVNEIFASFNISNLVVK